MDKNARILITGGYGLVGSALFELLTQEGYSQVFRFRSKECNLMDSTATSELFEKIQPEYVFHSAAAVYGIMGNMERQGWSNYANNLINLNTVEACRRFNVKKIVAMGTGCIYPYPPKSLPLKEDEVWFGLPHDSELGYAQAKRAMLAQLTAYQQSFGLNFAFVISGNLFGPHDSFDSHSGHVIPSLIRKFFEAETSGGVVSVWGDGSARRDFLHAHDMARALVSIMNKLTGSVNVASGRINAISDIVTVLANHTGLAEKVVWDSTKPNGQDYRAYDLSKLSSTGFAPSIDFTQGLRDTYDWYKNNNLQARAIAKDSDFVVTA